MLAGGIGGRAINVLNSNGIEVIRGCSGEATEVVKAYLKGLVEDSRSSCRTSMRHIMVIGHDHGHQCNHN